MSAQGINNQVIGTPSPSQSYLRTARGQAPVTATDRGVDFDARAGGFWELDLQHGSEYWSRDCLEILGVDDFDSTLATFQTLIEPESSDRFMAAIADAIGLRKSFLIELRLSATLGKNRRVVCRGECDFDDGGRPRRILGILHPIVEQEMSDPPTGVSESRLRATIDNLLEGCQILDSQLRYVYLNPNASRHARRAANELIGQRVVDAYPGVETTDVYAAIVRCLHDGIPCEMENRFAFPDGSVGEFQLRILPASDGVVILSYETTEQKLADEELRASRQRLETLSRQLITTRETELRHLARELHDEVGQSLTLMKMNLRDIQRSVDESTRSRLDENIAMVEQVVNQIRNLSLNMRPPHLDDLGLVATLRWYLKQQARIAGFQERLVVIPAEIQIPSQLVTVCFRITQEAVTNAMRHAAPSKVEIELRQSDNALHLTIFDDGKGFDVELAIRRASKGESLGIISIQERAHLAGGHSEITSTIGQGTRIHAWFPLN